MGAPDPRQFTIRREAVRNGVHLAFVHEGVGGMPLLLVQWEAAPVLNTALEWFCKDLRTR